MKEISVWLLLLWKRWLILFTGGGLAGIFYASVSLIERWGRTMSKEWYALIIFFIFVVIAMFLVWRDEHRRNQELREARRGELYKFVPLAWREHVFKIIYDVHLKGLMEEDPERRKKWDEEVQEILKRYFNVQCLNGYLLATRRMFGSPNWTDLKDENHNKAIQYLDRLMKLQLDFRKYLKPAEECQRS